MSKEASPGLLAAFLAHYDELARRLSRRPGLAGQAGDVLQDAWLRLAAPPPHDQPDARTAEVRDPRAFVFRVAGNLAVDVQRRDARAQRIFAAPETGDAAADPAPSPEARLLARERLRRLDEALDELPPKVKAALLLHRLDGLTHGDIAARLGVSESMVAKYIGQALRHCRRRLTSAGLGEE